MKKPAKGALLLVLILVAPACGGDDKPADDTDAGMEEECMMFDSRHEELLNAPTESTVVRKTPTHPPVEGELP